MSKLRKWMMKEERDTTSSGSGDLSSSAIKLFGKTIAVSASADSASVSVSTKAGSEEVDGASTQLEGENLGSSPGSICNETGSKDGDVVNGDPAVPEVVDGSLVVEESSPSLQLESKPTSSSSSAQQPKVENSTTPQRALTQEEKKEQCLKKPDKLIPCPRCESVDTKFCYYNNYNINQPRHFCKSCQRYWTAGGTLRNVLVGAGRRKNKYGVGSKQETENNNSSAVRMDHHEPAQQPAFAPAVMNAYTLGTVPPMNIPRHGQSPRSTVAGSDSSTVTTMGLASAFKPLGPEVSSDSVSKLRQRTQPDVSKGDSASSGDTLTPTYVLTPRAAPETQQAVWTKSSAGAPLGFFNGAWPYGFNIGWSGAGAMPPGTPSLCATAHSVSLGSGAPSPVWTGMWASAAPVPTFGWNMLQGGWTLPWRPVPAVGVQMQQSQSQGASSIPPPPPPRKRESPSLAEGERGKIARVGSGEEAVAA